MNRLAILLLGSSLVFAVASCTNLKPEEINPDPTGDAGLVTAIGKPVGTPVVGTIGPAGGSLIVPGSGYTLEIPAGALSTPTSITLQLREKTLPSGAGLAFTIAPKDLKLAKPASVAWHYTPQTISGSAPELVGIAYQDDKGVWNGTMKTQVDPSKRTIRARLRSLAYPVSWFEQFYMESSVQAFLPNERVKLKLFFQPGRLDEAPEDMLVPLVGALSDDKFVEHLAEKEINSWKLNGELVPGQDRTYVVGKVEREGRGDRATYFAPRAMLPKADNPVAISVDLKLKKGGRITLVANLTMIDPENEFKVAGRPFKNAYVEAIAQRTGGYCDINLWENTTKGSTGRADVNLLIHESVFSGTGTYVVKEDDQEPSITMSAHDGRTTYVSSWYPPKALRQKHGPITVKITEYGGPGKPIAGQVSATLHAYDRVTDSWQHTEVSARFRVVNNYLQGG